jgi:L-lactate dehydrogenase complex protein LldG
MSSRATILARLRHSGQQAAATAAEPGAASVRVPRAPDLSALIERFTQLAAATQMSVVRVHAAKDIPAAVRAYLGEPAAQQPVVVDTLLDITAADWNRNGLQCSRTEINPDGDVYIREGLAAIAECGAVVIASGAGRSLRNDFLAHTHIVVVPLERLLPDFSDLWAVLRAQQAAAGMAREVCLITGPSRTADLGVPAKLGAHGPARVHVLLVE